MTDAGPALPLNFGLAGRIVLVTGGVRGVGAGISAVFADQGATVVTCARRPVEGLPYGFVECDVRDAESVAGLIDGAPGGTASSMSWSTMRADRRMP